MTLRRIDCGFIPLVDSAPLIIARELGFAEEEGVDLVLHKEPSWAAVRDKLVLGQLDAAHLLAPVAIAMSMGLGGIAKPLDALSVLSVNGNVVGVSPQLAEKMRKTGEDLHLLDARSVGSALISSITEPLRVGVPFPFSMHAELLYYWFSVFGLRVPEQLAVRTVPPPLMADAIAAGEIDAFCVGEPWGSLAAEKGVAELVLPGCAIWQFAPEKVLAVRKGWAEREKDLTAALMRAVWRAARWLVDPSHPMTASEIVSAPPYLSLAPEAVERTLRGRIVRDSSGEEVAIPRLMEFFDCATTFPWRSQAAWIADRLARRMGFDRGDAIQIARSCFRPDLYRANLAPLGADMPGASEKVEGMLQGRIAVASANGEMFLGPDSFFDGSIFDPSA